MLRLLFLVLLIAAVYGVSVGPVGNLHIVNQFIAPDGFNRSAVLASATGSYSSATLPGPVVIGQKGDRMRINVINSLTNASMLLGTSIHWHGIFQHNSPWEDGGVGVSQCPIASGDSFVYDFTVPNQAGTFWYHAHYSAQYCDGLRGALVIYDPHDPYKKLYDVDDESTIITLSDWYHDPAPALLKRTDIFSADSILINGRGRYPGGPASPLSVITVKPNTRYRFRLVSVACGPSITFSIDNHPLTIIEVDGVNVEPIQVDSVELFPGQRYSVVVHTNKLGPPQNVWIRAKPSDANSTLFDGGLNSAILRYSGAPKMEPAFSDRPPLINPMVETNLHPLENPGAPGGSNPADFSLNLDINFDIENFIFTVNGARYIPPTVPVLLQILSGTRSAQELMPVGNVYSLKPNQVIELTIPGNMAGFFPHPFHLHGHTFDVIRSAGNNTPNYINPVRRDVVNTGNVGDNVTIRFKTDNSGPWFFHCHIEGHFELGLAIIFAEDIPAISRMDPPPSWDNLCPTFDARPPETAI